VKGYSALKIESVAVGELKNYPKNPRKGNVAIIAESLEAYGHYKPITVNKNNNEILAGNHTYRAAVELGWSTIDVVYVDVDDTTAAKIVAIDNRSTDVSEYDNAELKALLESLPDLDGSGYDDTDLDDLRALLDEAANPTVGHFAEVKKGETGQNGTTISTTLEEYAERYAQKASRMLIADYPNDTYVWLLGKLGQYREENKITSNADAIISLVETYYGESAPNETV
jgi:ParB-like chromosome segregation protein Spo0J